MVYEYAPSRRMPKTKIKTKQWFKIWFFCCCSIFACSSQYNMLPHACAISVWQSMIAGRIEHLKNTERTFYWRVKLWLSDRNWNYNDPKIFVNERIGDESKKKKNTNGYAQTKMVWFARTKTCIRCGRIYHSIEHRWMFVHLPYMSRACDKWSQSARPDNATRTPNIIN